MFRKDDKKGFTLVEIVTVIAIIGLLMGILVPSVANIRTSMMKTKSKTQFRQYAMALDAFYEENGHFPQFLLEAENNKVNLSEHGLSLQNALKGKYHHFSQEEFSKNEIHKGKLVDAFDNPNIYVIVDTTGDGMIQTLELHEGRPMRARIALFTLASDGPDYEFIQCTI